MGGLGHHMGGLGHLFEIVKVKEAKHNLSNIIASLFYKVRGIILAHTRSDFTTTLNNLYMQLLQVTLQQNML